MDIMKFECTYNDWEGNIMLKIVYPARITDLLNKKDLIDAIYGRASIEDDRTLRVKSVRFYLEVGGIAGQ